MDTTAAALRDAFPEVKLSMTLTAPLTEDGVYDDRGVALFSVRATLAVYADNFDAAGEDAVYPEPWERADVALSRSAGTSRQLDLTIATMEGLVIDLTEAGDLSTILDETADYAHFLPLLSNLGGYSVHRDVAGQLMGYGNQLIILDRVDLAPAWRGLGGVGRLLTARSLRWLAPDALLVALHPFPTQFANRGDDPGFPAALAKVQAVWASLGFGPWQDDIWFLDPATRALADVVADLERDLGVTRDDDE